MRDVVKNLREKLKTDKVFVLVDGFYIKYLKGIGLKNQKGIVHGDEISLSIAAASIIAKVARDHKTGNLTSEEVEKINAIISNPSQYGVPAWMLNHRKDFETGEDKHYLSGNLHFVQENDLKRLKKIRSLRGIRHIRGLPVRGQRTRSNFRKGKGKVVGVAKKKEAAPAKAPAPAGKKEK